jgi:lambda family phage tail tape measure protein
MATPALNIPIRVTGDDDFKKKMNDTSSLVAHTSRTVAAAVIKMNSSWLASQGAAGATALAFGRVLGFLGPIALGITAVVDAFKLMAYATELAKKRIAEFNDVADKANKSGFSTEFFQRITKSGGEARDKINELTEALKRFNDASAPKLGGSDLQRRIDELRKAGNLSGNSGVGALTLANNAEERFRAMITLINQMMNAGERLAALDLANRAFGPQITEALRADAGYLDDMLKRADAMSKAKIISEDDLGRAIELKERMEAAERVLAEKWKPIQDDLAKLGMNYHASWVGITETLAEAVGYATQLYQALKQVPDWFSDKIGNADIWKSLTDATAAMGLNSDPASMGLSPISSVSQEDATAKLRSALQNRANTSRSMREASDVQSAVRGDTSKNPAGKGAAESANAFDRASEALTKHTAKMEADARAVGLGSGALEELRAKAQLMAAAQQAGVPITDAMRAKIDALAASARSAGEALAKAKIDSSIEFQSRTALLAPEDAAIAERLKPLFGNDVPAALASSQAAAMRFNGALKQVSTSISGSLESGLLDLVSGTKSVGDAFRDLGAVVIREVERMIIKLLIVGPLMKGLSGIGGGLLGGATGGLGGMGLSLLGTGGLFADGGQVRGPGTGRSDSIVARVSNGEFITNAASTAKYLPILKAINADRIPKFADGGLVSAYGAGSAPIAANNNALTISAPINVKVEGGSRGPQADEALAKSIGKQVEASMRDVVGREIRNQLRPGGMLKR